MKGKKERKKKSKQASKRASEQALANEELLVLDMA